MIDPKITYFQSQFNGRKDLVHLNNAGLSLTSMPAREIIQEWIKRFSAEGMHCDKAQLMATQEARVHVASLLGCQPNELALFQSAAVAISQVAFGFPLQVGDEVVTWDQEYPSNLYPWKSACDRAGAKLKIVTSDPFLRTPAAKLVSAFTPQTKVVAISWVQYLTGSVTDLRELSAECRARGIFLCVDILQGFGLLPFDFAKLDIDAVCGGSHKWTVSPLGVGFLALKPKWHRVFRPLAIGALTYGTCDDPSQLECAPKLDALRFEPGSKPVLEIFAFAKSCRLIQTTGVDSIQNHVEALSSRLVEGLEDLGLQTYQPRASEYADSINTRPVISTTVNPARVRGSIVNFGFGPPKSNYVAADDRDQRLIAIAKSLDENKISYIWRGPGLRLSPHAFNTFAEIEFTLDCIASVVRAGSAR